jgi:hypothetical protein
MREHKIFQNFIDALNYKNSLVLDQYSKTKIQKKDNQWIIYIYEETNPEIQRSKNNNFSRIMDDIEYIESKRITFEKYYNFLPIHDLLIRVKENNILFIDKINLIKEIIIAKYSQKNQEYIYSLLKTANDTTEKSLLRKALKIIKEREAIQKKELVDKLKELEFYFNNLSYEEIEKLWINREEEGFFEETDEYIMLEYFFKKKKMVHLNEMS